MRITPYIQLMRFDRPIGISLLLWPTLIALELTSADLHTTVIFVVGVIVMRAAGCVINDIADHKFDRQVERTKDRPLALGLITIKQAWLIFAFLLLFALTLALQLKFQTIALSVIAVLLAIIYPFMKRITNYPQLVLGIAFAWSIPMVYMQVKAALPIQAWILFASTVAWVIAYDTQYAMADRAEDLVIGIKSTAIAFANLDRIIVGILQGVAIVGFVALGANIDCMFVATSLLIYQQWLIKDRDPKRCIKAFLNNNYFGMALFASILF